MRLRWLGQSAFHLTTSDRSILIDPFISQSPTAPKDALEGVETIDAILLTHGHDDHLGDTIDLAKRYGSTLVAQFEICMWANAQGIENLQPMNTGGKIDLTASRSPWSRRSTARRSYATACRSPWAMRLDW